MMLNMALTCWSAYRGEVVMGSLVPLECSKPRFPGRNIVRSKPNATTSRVLIPPVRMRLPAMSGFQNPSVGLDTTQKNVCGRR